jgi:hypothetical protein
MMGKVKPPMCIIHNVMLRTSVQENATISIGDLPKQAKKTRHENETCKKTKHAKRPRQKE